MAVNEWWSRASEASQASKNCVMFTWSGHSEDNKHERRSDDSH